MIMNIVIEDVFSNCCGALPFYETYYYSDLDLITGLCSQCKEHCHFLEEGDDDE
tara:strand:+ start:714 stop:875 length:162 start_codon:yes stop_codon:yes gene_type:complete